MFKEESPKTLTLPGPTLRGQRLVRTFGTGEVKVTAVNHVSIDLYPGQIVLLMGPSGSGKSTLLAILSGLLHPDSGQVLTMGQNLWQMSDRQRERFRLAYFGFIFQGYNLFPALTARAATGTCAALGRKHQRSRGAEANGRDAVASGTGEERPPAASRAIWWRKTARGHRPEPWSRIQTCASPMSRPVPWIRRMANKPSSCCASPPTTRFHGP